MREALARSDFDAVRRAPAPKRVRGPATPVSRAPDERRAPRATAPEPPVLTAFLRDISGLAASAVVGAFRRYPAALGGGLTGAVLAVSIIVNAAFLQEGTHPSPLFGENRADAPAQPAPKPASAARPSAQAPRPPAPRPTGTAEAAVQPQPPRRNEAAAAAPAVAAPTSDDAIAHLLATGAPPREAKPAGVLGVQKALVKLGYAITADGLMGPATRQAIMAFEKLEGLPQTGDPATTGMRRALAVAAGTALD
ncbi:peptidoglycan-binding protein [Pseudochelatococcus lubricantis]|uniref:peptidoglycan-binding domain-containing protein n=1 Tax=Pseudochelatococcus lubricantis TaxID=1538102 RepID=UPI0035E56E99